MSDRRAAIRRERKMRDKAEKNKSPMGEIKRAEEQGKIDGRTIAASVVIVILYQQFGFREKRIMDVLNGVNTTAMRFDNDVTRFVLTYFGKRLGNKINQADDEGEIKVSKMNSIPEQVYCLNRDDFFISSCAVMFSVLHDKYNFSTNDKDSGRLDLIMEYATNEYIKIQLDPEKHNAEFYYNRAKEITGLKF